MKEERVPVYCPKCKTEWQPDATCCSGCGAKLAQKKVPPPPYRSGAKEEREIKYIEETTITERFIVTTYRPILTAEERERRMKQIRAAAENILRDQLKKERMREILKEKAEQN